MDAAMDEYLGANGLVALPGGRPALSLRGDEHVPYNRCNVPHLARGVPVHARTRYEGPDQHSTRQDKPRTEERLGERDKRGLVRLVEGDPELSKGSIGSQLLVWQIRIRRCPVGTPAWPFRLAPRRVVTYG